MKRINKSIDKYRRVLRPSAAKMKDCRPSVWYTCIKACTLTHTQAAPLIFQAYDLVDACDYSN